MGDKQVCSLPSIVIERKEGYKQDPLGVPGRIYRSELPFHKQSPICYTLERPWLNNNKDNPKTSKNESSCIPEGRYLVTRTYSPKFKRKTFELMNVPGRSAIRIHSAKNILQLLGCIATATFLVKDETQYHAADPKTALAKLEAALPDIFTLDIIEQSDPERYFTLYNK